MELVEFRNRAGLATVAGLVIGAEREEISGKSASEEKNKIQ